VERHIEEAKEERKLNEALARQGDSKFFFIRE